MRARGHAARRFSVTVSESDYQRLKTLAERRRPPLSLQYVAAYAVQLLLRMAEDPEIARGIGDPLAPAPLAGRRAR